MGGDTYGCCEDAKEGTDLAHREILVYEKRLLLPAALTNKAVLTRSVERLRKKWILEKQKNIILCTE